MTLYYVCRKEKDNFLLIGNICNSYHGKKKTTWNMHDTFDLFYYCKKDYLAGLGFKTIPAAKRSPAYRDRSSDENWEFIDATIVKIDFDNFDKGFQEV